MIATPKCPYCGDKMELIIVSPECINGTSTVWYQCVVCESASPTSECPANSPRKEIVKKALALAMHRVEPKNRVLTLEEARNAEVDTFGTAMHWLELKIHTCKVQCEEIRCAVLAVSIFFEDQSEDGEPDAVYSYADRHDEWLTQEEYGKRWRCWLRKPTPKEMEETPWAGDSHE